jgi:hypothetical protein
LTSGRDDVVELQNPHGLPSVSINKAPPKAAVEKAKPAQAKSAVTAIKAKEADPCVCVVEEAASLY